MHIAWELSLAVADIFVRHRPNVNIAYGESFKRFLCLNFTAFTQIIERSAPTSVNVWSND